MTAQTAKDRYAQMFRRLRAKNEGAFVPFVTLGDPNPATSERIVRTLLDAGADALELGLPFSDPVADGPTIQAANLRALSPANLAAGAGVAAALDIIRRLRADYPEVPMGLLVYANLVEARGLPTFYAEVAAAGADSVLVADVPTREGRRFSEAAKAAGVQPIYIAPPDAAPEVLVRVARQSEGYVYLLARAGVTGTETAAARPAEAVIGALREAGAPPTLLGFGISRPEQVQQALAAGADGAISGSAVVQLIAENIDDEPKMMRELRKFIRAMKSATQGATQTQA